MLSAEKEVKTSTFGVNGASEAGLRTIVLMKQGEAAIGSLEWSVLNEVLAVDLRFRVR